MKTSFNRDYDRENVLSVRLKEAAVAMYNISLRISVIYSMERLSITEKLTCKFNARAFLGWRVGSHIKLANLHRVSHEAC